MKSKPQSRDDICNAFTQQRFISLIYEELLENDKKSDNPVGNKVRSIFK